jgi:hypothetical protein
VAFAVLGSQCDSNPPALALLSVSPSVVSNDTATEIQIAVTAHDEGSGMRSISGFLRGPDAGKGQFAQILFACTRSASDPEAPWVGRLTIPQAAATGTWRLGLLRLEDNAKNTRDYWLGDPATAGVTVEVR